VYLVLSSAMAGGKPGLFSYDPGAATWVLLGGGGGKPLTLTGGREMRSIGVPVGAMMMWVTATAPAGWLFAHGQTFTAAQYPELALVFPSLKLPDMRGAYPRGAGLNGNGGWGDAANTVGGWQEDSTARPKTDFFTDVQGDHHHTYQRAVTVINAGINGYSATDNDGGEAATRTSNSGLHTHSITGGGDPETRPKTLLVEFIIKAQDNAITLLP
jgi:hypothetical protein